MEQARSTRMSRGEFRRWCTEQGGKRYERVDGEPVAMSPETRGHTRLKYRIWQALDAAIVDLGLPCQVVGDGAMLRSMRKSITSRTSPSSVENPFPAKN